MSDNKTATAVKDIHHLYCQLTGQQLALRYDRERLWFEFLRAGFAAEELRRVVRYLQKEIRAGRRNIGALKIFNLLQLDRFEEDLNISRVRLSSPCTPSAPKLWRGQRSLLALHRRAGNFAPAGPNRSPALSRATPRPSSALRNLKPSKSDPPKFALRLPS